MEIKLFNTDYVLIKNGKRVEGLDIIYGGTENIQEFIPCSKDGIKAVSMTDLPKELQDEYIEYLRKNP